MFSKDLREAAEVGASTNTVGNYELHDLVLLGYAHNCIISSSILCLPLSSAVPIRSE